MTSKPLRTAVIIFLSFLISQFSWATTELDRQYELKTVGFLKSWDNMDELFADYVSQAYKDYFAHQSRFVLQDLSKADEVLSKTKLPYYKVIEDTEVLSQLARSTRSQSIIRTLIRKEGPQYRFHLDWLNSPRMDVISSEEFILTEPGGGKPIGSTDIRDELGKALDRLFAKVPFVANVTGRDNSSITINIGSNSNVKKGDTLVIGTLDEVKRHPLLKEIVSWRLTETGRAEVDSADEAISFAHVTEEQPGREVQRLQKVLQVIPAPAPSPVITQEKTESDVETPPKLGYLTGSLWPGSMSRQFSTLQGGTTSGAQGGGLFVGANAAGELWLNREFFTDLSLGFGFNGYSQTNLTTGAATPVSSVSGSATDFRFSAGYSYLVSGDFFGPKAWVKLGYHSIAYSLPANGSPVLTPAGTESTSPTSFYGLFVSVGGDVPIRSVFGVTLNVDYGILTGASDSSGLFGDLGSATDGRVFVGGYYKYTTRIRFQLGFDMIFDSGSYSATNSSVSQKIISISPGIVYYF